MREINDSEELDMENKIYVSDVITTDVYVSKFYNENEIERSRESVLKFTKRNVD
ncbi:hypothetical protein bmyco0002_20500 [Bacillus pseudomycoides]|jgi:hypothetical protein|nr:hypothetical protein bmyco0002_20500 [Bacillus pseudomycoides]